MDMLVQGGLAAVMVLWLLSYFPWRRVFACAWFLDTTITITMMWMFKGSFAGMMTGVVAGVIISLFLRIGRKTMGVEKPIIARRKGELTPSLVWQREKI